MKTAIALLFAASNLSAGVVAQGALMSGANVSALIQGFKKTAAGMPAPQASAAPAAVPTYSGHSRWTTSSGKFSPLKQLGVMKSAEQDAVMKCQESGNVNCVATASQVTTCGGYSCEADAM